MARRCWWNGPSPRAASVAGHGGSGGVSGRLQRQCGGGDGALSRHCRGAGDTAGGRAPDGRLHQQAGTRRHAVFWPSSGWSAFSRSSPAATPPPTASLTRGIWRRRWRQWGSNKRGHGRRPCQRYQRRRRAWACRAFSSPGAMATRKAAMLSISPSELPGLIAANGLTSRARWPIW